MGQMRMRVGTIPKTAPLMPKNAWSDNSADAAWWWRASRRRVGSQGKQAQDSSGFANSQLTHQMPAARGPAFPSAPERSSVSLVYLVPWTLAQA